MIKMFPGVTGQCGEQGYLITISGKQVFFFFSSPHCETYGILVPQPGMELVTKWKHQVLTTGLPGNSRN